MGSKKDAKPRGLPWQELAAYVQEELVPDGTSPILENTPLISSGLLDSYSVVELIARVEERFDVEVGPSWHRVEHFDSLECIARTVESIRRQHRV